MPKNYALIHKVYVCLEVLYIITGNILKGIIVFYWNDISMFHGGEC